FRTIESSPVGPYISTHCWYQYNVSLKMTLVQAPAEPVGRYSTMNDTSELRSVPSSATEKSPPGNSISMAISSTSSSVVRMLTMLSVTVPGEACDAEFIATSTVSSTTVWEYRVRSLGLPISISTSSKLSTVVSPMRIAAAKSGLSSNVLTVDESTLTPLMSRGP